MNASRLTTRPAGRPRRSTWIGSRRIARRSRASLRLEHLEDRVCLSAFYDIDVLSRSDGESAQYPSVNNAGEVSFVRGRAFSGLVDGTFLSDGISLTQVTQGEYRGIQLNDRGELLAIRTTFSAGKLHSSLGVFEIASGSFREIARTSSHSGPGGPPTDFEGGVLGASINNLGEVAFIGQPRLYNEQGNLDYSLPFKLYLSDSFVSAASPGAEIEVSAGDLLHNSTVDLADNGDILLTVPGESVGGRIDLYPAGGGITRIASTDSGPWLRIPGPGRISDDGAVIVFTANRGNGAGVFASVAVADNTRSLVTIVGEADTSGDGVLDGNDTPYPDLGYNASGNPIYFDFGLFQGEFTTTALPSVTTFQNPGGAADAIDPGESFVVMFLGTPSEVSRLNPITGQPLLFSASEGIWTTLIRAQGPLDGSGPAEYLRSSAHKVVQRDDTIAGHTVSRFLGLAQTATAGRDTTGASRTVSPGDHHVAFAALVENSTASIVVRASQIDSDGDGLYDHWETEGVDIDQDGTIDLNLPAMGAQPLRKDLFMEVDWIADDNPAGNPGVFRSFEPDPNALDFLVDVFATAPVTNPDGTMGITVHIDAGAGLSRNMGPVPLQGGDRIAEAGTGNHIQVLYFGGDGTLSFPGQVDVLGRPIVTRSVENIKADFFGAADKWARELAFRYVLFGDRHSGPNEGSSGQAEFTFYGSASFHTIPGNDFLVTLQGALDPATLDVPAGGPPGTLATIPTPSAFLHGQTLVHELGHTLGLRHGGNDNITTDPPNWGSHVPAAYKPDYRSLMNYAYQFGVSPDGSLVRTYSSTVDAVFDDWSNIQLGFNRYYDNLGNTLGIEARGGELPPGADTPEPSVAEFLQVNNPVAPLAPVVAIALPASFKLTLGESLLVPVTATDDGDVASVIIEFDANGDGAIDPVTERLTALLVAPDSFRATFGAIAGPAGNRTVIVTATDNDGRATVTTATVTVHVAATPPADKSGPTVVSVSRSGFSLTSTVLRVTFSEDLAPSRARDPGNYNLIHPGRDGRFGTRDDRVIGLRSVAYDAAARTVVLTPARRISVVERVRLTVNGSRESALTDLAGNRLDGNGDGRAGGDYVVTIRGFASGPGQGRNLRPLDFNGDSKVNAEDFQLIRKQRRLNPFALIQARRMMAAIR